ncbi:ensconsin isoform X2 [Clupea harengus]|uniref:Ensconsin isoform X2 n=1 Tax=Clupea harengus TaxID=7950 RepID=A0A6P8GN73_CLUHA|nr:ensconsin isoform X2 [Clupea harengus]
MPASCASVPAPMKRSVCSPDLSIIKDEIEEGIAEKERRRRGSGMDPKPNPAKKRVGQPHIQNKTRDTAEHGLKVDERLRLARERREQQQKVLASREQGWLAKEERAKRHYEKHLEERRQKLEEQRSKEERRRVAVEEKRRQRLHKEKERYEQVVKRTMERSQNAKQKLSLLSRRAKANTNKAPRYRLTEWEKDLVRRLQTPTIAHLARSRSVGAPEADAVFHCCRRSASCHQVRSSSAHKVESSNVTTRPKTPAVKSNLGHTHHKTTKAEQYKQKSVSTAEKRISQKNQKSQMKAVPEKVRPSPPPDPPPERPVFRAVSRRPAPQLEGFLPPLPEEEPDPGLYCNTPSQNGVTVGGATDVQSHTDEMTVDGGPQRMEEGNLDTPPPSPNLCPVATVQLNIAQPPPASSSSCSRSSAGTSDPEEASRMLAEKRRQARQQREEKRREEFERQALEELARRQAEENARLEAETHQRLEEDRKREEEEQKQMEDKKRREEEQKQIEEENTRRLKRQREEEEARHKELELRQQREKHFQKEEEQRQERKKRLEEIMKRTRKADSAEGKPAPASSTVTEPPPKENTEPVGKHREDVILLSGPSQANKLDLDPREDVVPSVTFKERRSLRTLTGLDHIQSQQRAEVI